MVHPALYDRIIEPLIAHWKHRLAHWLEDESGRILDVGCGIGRQVETLHHHQHAAFGLDLNKNWLKYAKRRTLQLNLVCGDATRLPFKDHSFSVILFSLALHEQDAKLRSHLLNSLPRLLTSDGKIGIIDFEKPRSFKSKLGFLFVSIFEVLAGWTHFRNGQRFIRQNGVTGLTEAHGWQPIQYHFSETASTSTLLAQLSVWNET